MSETDAGVQYSIVVPVYCNEGSLTETCEELCAKVIEKNPSFKREIIFVDDGSTDGSFNELMKIRESYPGLVKVVRFTRNFGQVAAIMAGYHCASGDVVINISADLQDPPELINEMLRFCFDEGYDIVIATRDSRDEPAIRTLTSRVFYATMRKLSFANMPLGGFDFVAISSRVKRNILDHPETSPFWQGQILWTGFRTRFIPYHRRARKVGESKWTFSRKLKYLVDGVLGYSYLPLRLMSMFGVSVSFVGILYAVYIVIAYLLGQISVQGWAPLMVVNLILSGILMLMIGVVGEYLWRALEQIRNRQPYIVDRIYE